MRPTLPRRVERGRSAGENARRGVPRDAGLLLITALLFSVTLLALTAAVITTGVSTQAEKRYVIATYKATEASETAVHLAVARLKMPMGPVVNEEGAHLSYAVGGTGKRATRLAIDVFAGTRDGADNDLDGEVDEFDEYNLLELIATARHDNVGRALRVTLRRFSQDYEPSSPIELGEESAVTTYSGASHLVSGAPVDIYGNALPDAPLHSAIGVAGDPAGVVAQLPKQNNNTIIGNPQVRQIPPIDLAPFLELAQSSADIRLPAGRHRPDPHIPDQWGTVDTPKLLLFSGDAEIATSEQGVGVMVVDGDLDIAGGFQWTGVIVATGAVRFRGGGKANRIVGSAIIAGSSDPLEDDLRIDGTVDALYSPEAVAHVLDSLYGRRISVLKWRQARVEEEEAP